MDDLPYITEFDYETDVHIGGLPSTADNESLEYDNASTTEIIVCVHVHHRPPKRVSEFENIIRVPHDNK